MRQSSAAIAARQQNLEAQLSKLAIEQDQKEAACDGSEKEIEALSAIRNRGRTIEKLVERAKVDLAAAQAREAREAKLAAITRTEKAWQSAQSDLAKAKARVVEAARKATEDAGAFDKVSASIAEVLVAVGLPNLRGLVPSGESFIRDPVDADSNFRAVTVRIVQEIADRRAALGGCDE